MKYQTMFSRKNKKMLITLSCAESASVKVLVYGVYTAELIRAVFRSAVFALTPVIRYTDPG